MNKIGTVEILRERIYQLDAEVRDPLASTVFVAPGHYDLWRDEGATFWVMRGLLNRRGSWRMGDGLFAMQASDEPSGIWVEFPSRRFGPDEWADLLAGPEFAEGEQQRLRLRRPMPRTPPRTTRGTLDDQRQRTGQPGTIGG